MWGAGAKHSICLKKHLKDTIFLKKVEKYTILASRGGRGPGGPGVMIMKNQ